MEIRNQRKLFAVIVGLISIFILINRTIDYYLHQPLFSDKKPNVYKLNLSIFENNIFKEYYILENPSDTDSINFSSINNYNLLHDNQKRDTIKNCQIYRQFYFYESRYMNRKYRPNFGIYIESDIRELSSDYYSEIYLKFQRKGKEDTILKNKVINNIKIE
jgi:hypothetical protein